MFETIDQTFALVTLYAQIGFALAVLYNLLRFVRLAFPELRVTAFILDVLFSLIAGFTLFAFSVEYGTGFFRLYYVAAAAFGFAVNMLTIGFAVPPLARLFGRAVSFILRKLAVPVRFICTKIYDIFIKISQKTVNFAENYKFRLQTRRTLLYNNTNHKIGEVYPEGGEHGNAVKAKVRKIE